MFKKLVFRALAFLVAVALAFPAYADDVLKTEHGARLKLIVRNDTAVFAEPNDSSRSQPLRQFEFFFVLPADGSGAKTKNGFYRIAAGTSEANAIGWIKSDDIVEWPHTQVLGFTKRAERDPANFFSSPQALESYLKEGSTDQAISREPEGVEILSLMPILVEKKIDVNGEEVKTFQVAYIHTADPKNIVTPKKSLTIPQIQKELTLDIVFVIDTTSSMKPYIDAAKEVIRKISTAVNSNQKVKGRVRLGLVGYRDKDDSYVSKILCTLEAGVDLAKFESALGNVKAEGGGDTPEQVYAGLKTAVTQMHWGTVANRAIILIGDAANHEDHKSIVSCEAVLAAAQPSASSDNIKALIQHITIHTLQVGEGSGPEFEMCRRQFTTLAAGRHFAGVSANTGNVTTFMNSLMTTLTNRVVGTEYAIRGETEKLEAMGDPNGGSIGAVMQYLGKEKLVGATFANGYASEIDAKGNRTVEPYVLVARNDLRAFKSALEFCVTTLEGAGEPGSKDVARILNSLKTLTVHLGYGDQITANTPLKDVMQLILGLPIKSSCFDMTPARLCGMSQKDFDSWVKQVDASHSMVDGHIATARWFNLGRETKQELRFAFVRVSDLP